MSLLTIFLASLASAQCPAYTCAELSTDICMTWSNNAVQFNKNSCTSHSQSCLISKAMLEYSFNPSQGNYSCEASSSLGYTYGFMDCGEQLETEIYLKSGTFPKSCSSAGYSDENCLLEDGNYLECGCGFDSLLYCKPNPSSYVFKKFWDTCSDQDNIVTSEFYEYYDLLYSFYVEYNTAPDCALTLFQEFGILQGTVPKSSSAVFIGLGAIIAVFAF
ncbi:unnamed protein product [Blepharisma stoltei]|uniref:Uncharacterized protein n=1 Tax=Blepharisma stoltei TaxID=1481888 RepID=A0AAU9J793_9CILI|nr:unnamed protein product [Blepharisma stoltei]